MLQNQMSFNMDMEKIILVVLCDLQVPLHIAKL